MNIAEALADLTLLCVETAPFIYFTENRPGYVDKMRVIFERVTDGRLDVVTSTITLTECLPKPLREHDNALANTYKAMSRSTHGIRLIPVSAAIAEHAADLRASYNLRTPDALHLATALSTGCEAFLTNDQALKRVQELRVLVLDDLTLQTTG